MMSNQIQKGELTPRTSPLYWSSPRTIHSSGKKRKYKNPFKSPLTKEKPEETPETVEKLQQDIETFKEREKELDLQIQQLTQQGFCEEELATHIEKLHEYNEIKDVAQTLIGRIAVQKGVTTKELYETFGLDLDD